MTLPYTAQVINDHNLETAIIALSYTDAHDPTRNVLACIAPELGSNFYRFSIGTHELLHCEPETLKQSGGGGTGTFVLWPFPNRVRDRQYTYQGHEYSLRSVHHSLTDQNLVHGLVYDRAWSYEELYADEQSASVTTYVEVDPATSDYKSYHFDEGYPFPSRLSLTYTLTNAGITVTYTVQNKGLQTLPYGFALHPYFNLLAGRAETLVSLPADQLMEADAALLPTGRMLDVHSVMYAMFNLKQPTPIDHLKLDHVYTVLPTPHEVCIDYHGLDLSLRISASDDFTHTVIYAPEGEAFFCLENQTCSTDAINLAQQGMQEIAHLLEVQPGEKVSGFIHFGVEHC